MVRDKLRKILAYSLLTFGILGSVGYTVHGAISGSDGEEEDTQTKANDKSGEFYDIQLDKTDGCTYGAWRFYLVEVDSQSNMQKKKSDEVITYDYVKTYINNEGNTRWRDLALYDAYEVRVKDNKFVVEDSDVNCTDGFKFVTHITSDKEPDVSFRQKPLSTNNLFGIFKRSSGGSNLNAWLKDKAGNNYKKNIAIPFGQTESSKVERSVDWASIKKTVGHIIGKGDGYFYDLEKNPSAYFDIMNSYMHELSEQYDNMTGNQQKKVRALFKEMGYESYADAKKQYGDSNDFNLYSDLQANEDIKANNKSLSDFVKFMPVFEPVGTSQHAKHGRVFFSLGDLDASGFEARADETYKDKETGDKNFSYPDDPWGIAQIFYTQDKDVGKEYTGHGMLRNATLRWKATWSNDAGKKLKFTTQAVSNKQRYTSKMKEYIENGDGQPSACFSICPYEAFDQRYSTTSMCLNVIIDTTDAKNPKYHVQLVSADGERNVSAQQAKKVTGQTYDLSIDKLDDNKKTIEEKEPQRYINSASSVATEHVVGNQKTMFSGDKLQEAYKVWDKSEDYSQNLEDYVEWNEGSKSYKFINQYNNKALASKLGNAYKEDAGTLYSGIDTSKYVINSFESFAIPIELGAPDDGKHYLDRVVNVKEVLGAIYAATETNIEADLGISSEDIGKLFSNPSPLDKNAIKFDAIPDLDTRGLSGDLLEKFKSETNKIQITRFLNMFKSVKTGTVISSIGNGAGTENGTATVGSTVNVKFETDEEGNKNTSLGKQIAQEYANVVMSDAVGGAKNVKAVEAMSDKNSSDSYSDGTHSDSVSQEIEVVADAVSVYSSGDVSGAEAVENLQEVLAEADYEESEQTKLMLTQLTANALSRAKLIYTDFQDVDTVDGKKYKYSKASYALAPHLTSKLGMNVIYVTNKKDTTVYSTVSSARLGADTEATKKKNIEGIVKYDLADMQAGDKGLVTRLYTVGESIRLKFANKDIKYNGTNGYSWLGKKGEDPNSTKTLTGFGSLVHKQKYAKTYHVMIPQILNKSKLSSEEVFEKVQEYLNKAGSDDPDNLEHYITNSATDNVSDKKILEEAFRRVLKSDDVTIMQSEGDGTERNIDIIVGSYPYLEGADGTIEKVINEDGKIVAKYNNVLPSGTKYCGYDIFNISVDTLSIPQKGNLELRQDELNYTYKSLTGTNTDAGSFYSIGDVHITTNPFSITYYPSNITNDKTVMAWDTDNHSNFYFDYSADGRLKLYSLARNNKLGVQTGLLSDRGEFKYYAKDASVEYGSITDHLVNVSKNALYKNYTKDNNFDAYTVSGMYRPYEGEITNEGVTERYKHTTSTLLQPGDSRMNYYLKVNNLETGVVPELMNNKENLVKNVKSNDIFAWLLDSEYFENHTNGARGMTNACYNTTTTADIYNTGDRDAKEITNGNLAFVTTNNGASRENNIGVIEGIKQTNDNLVNKRLVGTGLNRLEGMTNFYPEVKMRGVYIGNTTGTGLESVENVNLYVMGRKLRKVPNYSYNTTSLSGFRIDANELGVKGNISSDTFSLSSEGTQESATNGNLPVIYSGGNVNVKVNSSKLELTTSGYYLDLVDKDVDDGTFYKGIVANNAEIKKTWNTTTNYKASKEFEDFTKDLKDSIKMEVSLQYFDKKAKFGEAKKGFKVQMGTNKIKDTKAKGVYSLVVAHGEIQETQAYKDLCLDMACDYYGVDNTSSNKAKAQSDFQSANGIDLYAQGKVLFAGSKVGQELLSAIESDSDTANNTSKNNDGKVWYDEVVRTFVVRKYTATVKLGDMVLSDKIPVQEGSTSSDKTLTGKWQFDLTIGDKTTTGIQNKYSFHIDDCDFVVSSESTNNLIR